MEMQTEMQTEKVYSVDEIQLAVLESFPPQLSIHVTGQASSSGWQNSQLVPYVYIQAPPDGIYDFDFVAAPPSGIVTQVITPISATYILNPLPDNLVGVRIHTTTNTKEALLQPQEEPKGEKK